MAGKLERFAVVNLITDSIARSASRRYLINSEADFEVFRPAGATRYIDGVKFGMEEGTEICNINAPQGRILCAIFTKFAEFVPHFRMPGWPKTLSFFTGSIASSANLPVFSLLRGRF